jgi:hypothetical protein
MRMGRLARGDGVLYSLRDRPLVMRVLILAPALAVAQRPATPFTTPLSLADMQNKQAVVETTLGSFVIDLLPQVAPNHVGYLIKLAREAAYDGTTFHRAIRLGLIQGGDPTSKDPAKRDQYGMGGLNMLKAEVNDVVEKIEAVEVNGETPRTRIELRRVRVN